MNILFLPINTASQPGITVASLNKLENVNAICLTTSLSKLHDGNKYVIYLERRDRKSVV